jgi:hypothetical protein
MDAEPAAVAGPVRHTAKYVKSRKLEAPENYPEAGNALAVVMQSVPYRMAQLFVAEGTAGSWVSPTLPGRIMSTGTTIPR